MNKLSVATNSKVELPKHKKILDYLGLHPEGATPKMIAVETAINVNTVKSILPKLQNIKTVTRGWYKVLNKGDGGSVSCGDLSDWNFHNLMLQVQLNHFNKPVTKTYDFDLIKINFIINNKGKCTARLSSDYPLNVSSITVVYAFLREKIKQFSMDYVSMTDISVKSIEFNRDYSNLKFEGIQSITLDSLCEQFKLYQKSIGLRVEHKTKLDFKVDTMVDMLTQSPNTLDLSQKLHSTQEQLNKLTTQSVYNTQQLTKLMERMRK